MPTLTPAVDRLGAALRAVRQASERVAQSEDKISLGTKCLGVVISQLAEEGLDGEDLRPLIDLEASLRHGTAQPSDSVADRRKGRSPSEALLARIAAVIDLLVKGG